MSGIYVWPPPMLQNSRMLSAKPCRWMANYPSRPCINLLRRWKISASMWDCATAPNWLRLWHAPCNPWRNTAKVRHENFLNQTSPIPDHSSINRSRNQWFVLAGRDSLRHDFFHYFLYKTYDLKQALKASNIWDYGRWNKGRHHVLILVFTAVRRRVDSLPFNSILSMWECF